MKTTKEDLIMMIQTAVSKHTRESERIKSDFTQQLLDLSTDLADDLIDIQMKVQEIDNGNN